MTKIRCTWCDESSQLYTDYHDTQWGVPVFNDHELFEMLILEGMQAGLSWITVLKKRANFYKALDGFDYHKIANYDEAKIAQLLDDPGIIRNRLKVKACIQNARVFMEIQEQYGSFSDYIWDYVDHRPIQNVFNSLEELPAQTSLSVEISKDLKKRGMNFVGPTIIYSFMQAIGMVNDHVQGCFRYQEIKNLDVAGYQQ